MAQYMKLTPGASRTGLQRLSVAAPMSLAPARVLRPRILSMSSGKDVQGKDVFPTQAAAKPAPTVTQDTARGEAARPYARTVYDFPQWQKHRSQNRLIERLLSIHQSNIMQNISSSVAWCTTVATLVTAYMYAYENHDLPPMLPSIAPSSAASAFISTTSVALSLLLVFRTNAGYGRWDEARKMWGLLVNRSRDVMRQACTMIPPEDVESKRALGRWMIAFTRSLRIHMQPEVTLRSELQNILTPAEMDMLEKSSHRPVKTLHMMSQVIQNANIHPMYVSTMSQNLTAFHDVLGGCERLLRAPIPVSYTRHTARFLFVWLSILPLALYGTCGYWTAPVVAGISAVLCGIEEIGVQVEEPFGILPLDVLCTRIQTDVLSTVADTEEVLRILPEPAKAASAPAPAPAPVPILVAAGINGNGNGSSNGSYRNTPSLEALPQLARKL